MQCRCCPGGISCSGRALRYPSDMNDAEWAVTEPMPLEPGWKQGRGGRLGGIAAAMSWTRSATW